MRYANPAIGAWLLLLLASTGCVPLIQRPVTHRPVPASYFDRRFSHDEIDADLRFMLRTCEAVHPELYFRATPEQVESRLRDVLARVGDSATRTEFYPLLAEFAASFGDGHTYAGGLPEEWEHFKSVGGRLFPCDIEAGDGGVLRVTHCHDAQFALLPGDVIESINGINARVLYYLLDSQCSGRPVYRANAVASAFRFRLWINGIAAPFDVAYTRESDRSSGVASSPGLTQQQIVVVVTSSPAARPVLPYVLSRIEPDIALIDFRSMTDTDAFTKFLDATFADLATNPTAGLIVDIRRNGGGNSQLADMLLDRITERSYMGCSRKDWKASREYRTYLKRHVHPLIRWLPLELLHPVMSRYFLATEGAVVSYEVDWHVPPPRADRFRGPVCVLIGPGTFSSAVILADAVATFDLATLIGDETGGEPSSFGEVYFFDLPNTRIAVGVSSARFVRANGCSVQPGGVMPDIEVRATPEDIRAGRDPVMERAREWIREQSASPQQASAALQEGT